MRFVKLLALGLGAALVSLTAMSSAANPNLTGVQAENGQIVEDEYLSLTVQGTGTCVLQLSTSGPDGKEYVDSTYGAFPHKLPTGIATRQFAPGKYTLTVTTLADPTAPDCAAGQKVSTTFNVIARPHCPQYWDETDFNPYTGAIACTPFDPTWDITCAGKTQKFFDPTENVCRSGCEAVQF